MDGKSVIQRDKLGIFYISDCQQGLFFTRFPLEELINFVKDNRRHKQIITIS